MLYVFTLVINCKCVYKGAKNGFFSNFYVEEFSVAYKFIDKGRTLLIDQRVPFIKLISPKDRWYADPVIVENGVDSTGIFMESYSKRKKKGEIAFINRNDLGKKDPLIVLGKDYHLSYPSVIWKENSFFMIPETSSKNTLEVFKCTHYPTKWDKYLVIDQNRTIVDSNLLVIDKNIHIVNSVVNGKNDSKYSLMISQLNNRFELTDYSKTIPEDLKYSRNAGSFFVFQDTLYRPAMDNRFGEYGRGISFMKCKMSGDYSESESLYVDGSMIKVTGEKRRIIGMHTYGIAGDLEIIDYKYKRVDFLIGLKKNLSRIHMNLRRVFNQTLAVKI